MVETKVGRHAVSVGAYIGLRVIDGTDELDLVSVGPGAGLLARALPCVAVFCPDRVVRRGAAARKSSSSAALSP